MRKFGAALSLGAAVLGLGLVQPQVAAAKAGNGLQLATASTQTPDVPDRARSYILIADVSDSQGPVSLADLSGSKWQLRELGPGQAVVPDTEITAAFEGDQMSGSTGCNMYGTKVTDHGDGKLTAGLIRNTMRACPKPVMKQEREFVTRLSKITHAELRDGELVLSYDTGTATGALVFEADPMNSGKLSDTEVITFVPTKIPSKTETGSCFTSAIGLGRTDAYRCMTETNQISDPCFVVNDKPTVVCGADPVKGTEGFVLKLTKPLPKPDPGPEHHPWMVVLADGTLCGLMTGTRPGIGDKMADYGCEGGSYLLGDFKEGKLWTADKADIGVGENGYFLKSSETVPIRTIWK